VLVEPGSELAAYHARPPYQRVFLDRAGGSALVVSPDGGDAFVGGNADRVITEVALPNGAVVRTFPVRRSGDMVWARGQVFSADIASGIMSTLNPRTGRVVRIPPRSIPASPTATSGPRPPGSCN
jgi:hypothetical protein